MPKISPTSINIARMLFVLLCVLSGMAIVLSTHHTSNQLPMWLGISVALGLAFFMIMVETLMKGFTLKGFSTATFGLMIGLFCAWLMTKVKVDQLIMEGFSISIDQTATVSLAVNTILFGSLGFIGSALALRTSHEDFAFVVPYVRFRRDSSVGQPVVVDAETLVDGRVPGLLASGFLRGRLIVPLFILEELQVMANSPSNVRRVSAQRALEQIEALQDNTKVEVMIHDATLTSSADRMDARLIEMAQNLGARLLTIDSNLAKAGRVRGATVLNINDLSEALKPSVVIGQRMRLPLVRPGKEDHQAVGYLPDGTMIVVNHAISQIGTSQDVTVISTIQTNAGQMVFAEMLSHEEEAA